MNIYVTSDLHRNPNDPQKTVERLADHLLHNGEEEDVLILAGDYSNNASGMEDCLSLFAQFPGTVIAIPGNHDVWGNRSRYTDFSSICKGLNIYPLTEGPIVLSGIGFAGCMGWYDYSFRDNIGIGEEAYKSKTYPGASSPGWMDAHYVNWGMTDQEVTNWQAKELDKQLTTLSCDPTVKRVYVAIHHVPIRDLLFLHRARWIIPKEWRFLNAFLGSTIFQEICERHAGIIERVVCGHIHNAKNVKRCGIRYSSIKSQYNLKQLLIIDPKSGRMIRRNFR